MRISDLQRCCSSRCRVPSFLRGLPWSITCLMLGIPSNNAMASSQRAYGWKAASTSASLTNKTLGQGSEVQPTSLRGPMATACFHLPRERPRLQAPPALTSHGRIMPHFVRHRQQVQGDSPYALTAGDRRVEAANVRLQRILTLETQHVASPRLLGHASQPFRGPLPAIFAATAHEYLAVRLHLFVIIQDSFKWRCSERGSAGCHSLEVLVCHWAQLLALPGSPYVKR